jgi:putative heme transporter
VGTTGIWNVFTKLALPVLSIAFLVAFGHGSAAYLLAAALGVVVLAVAVACLAAIFSSERLARAIGDRLGRAGSSVRVRFGRSAITDGGDRAARVRDGTIGLVAHRWLRLTLTTILSHLGLFLVLLLALRHMGVSEADVSTAEAFAVFAFSRLLSAVPITPGGVGVIDLGYVGGLTQMDPVHKPEIVAAVLLFRLLTFGIQVPLGGITYVVWRRKAAWRKEPPDVGRPVTVG